MERMLLFIIISLQMAAKAKKRPLHATHDSSGDKFYSTNRLEKKTLSQVNGNMVNKDNRNENDKFVSMDQINLNENKNDSDARKITLRDQNVLQNLPDNQDVNYYSN